MGTLQMPSEHIRALFDRIAPVYDSLNQGLSLGQHRIWKQMAVKWSGAQPGDTALDLCCGSGDLAQLLAQRVGPAGQVYGADFAPAQLEVARDRWERRCLKPPIHWVEADALHLPFENNFFHCATMGYGLRNVVDIPRSLEELHRVLRPGARAAILDFNHPTNPLVQTFQQWYLTTIVVPTAERFGLVEEYAYIGPSLERFPRRQEQVRLARTAGFAQATHYPIAGGTMGVLVVVKGD